ncbi:MULTISPECIES: hypothetical protein [Streptomyces]|uniref:hypothetical protein n=1 Tax=Streptomyces TaxID=1883 RepID=UPI00345C54C7
MTDRIHLDALTSNQLDRLYDERDILRGVLALLRTELDHWHAVESLRILRAELAALEAAMRTDR